MMSEATTNKTDADLMVSPRAELEHSMYWREPVCNEPNESSPI